MPQAQAKPEDLLLTRSDHTLIVIDHLSQMGMNLSRSQLQSTMRFDRCVALHAVEAVKLGLSKDKLKQA